MTTGTVGPAAGVSPAAEPAKATDAPNGSAQPQDSVVAQRLAAGAAHQMNNVLTVVSGHASVLLEILEDGHPARPGLEAILDASVSGAALATQLLSYAQEPQTPTDSLPVDAMVLQLVDRIRREAGPPIDVTADPPDVRGHVLVATAPLLEGMEFAGQYARALCVPSGGRVTVVARERGEVLETTIRIEPSRPGAGVSNPGLDSDAPSASASPHLPEPSGRILEPYAPEANVGKPDGMWLPAMAGAIRQAGGRLTALASHGVVELRLQLALAG